METVKAVKANGLRVEIAAWRGTISPLLEAESSQPVVYLDDIKSDIELTTPPDEEAEKLTEGDDT